MIRVKSEHLDKAIEDVLETVHGVRDLYPNQKELVETLFENDNIFYTDSTNSGKTFAYSPLPRDHQKAQHYWL